MDRCNGCGDVTEIMLKTAVNAIIMFSPESY